MTFLIVAENFQLRPMKFYTFSESPKPGEDHTISSDEYLKIWNLKFTWTFDENSDLLKHSRILKLAPVDSAYNFKHE